MEFICKHCKITKSSTEFYRSVKYKSGYFFVCKPCYNTLHPKRKRNYKVYTLEEIITPDKKYCSLCAEIKTHNEFYPSKRYKSGLMSQCKTCHIHRTPRRKQKQYSITEIEYAKEKLCKDCQQIKSTLEFYVSKRDKDGFLPRCKACYNVRHKVNKEARREYFQNNKDKFTNARLWRDYGITLDDYNTMLKEQNNRCIICDVHNSVLNRKFDVDHCHITGKVRGLLCNNCNKFLGLIDHDVNRLKKVEQYLNISHQKCKV